MSKPAARIGDIHVCPMVTPGTPPIPHVGGIITGPGVPTVLIGGMPAAVMGDMCVCVGPPDTIILGSTGVLIGGKPAARMGDSNAHGGKILAGCPTVLIGESSGGGGGGGAMANLQVIISEIEKVKGVEKSVLAKVIVTASQIASVTQAATDGLPFCEVCEPPAKDSDNESADGAAGGSETAEKDSNGEEIVKKIGKIYFTDENGNNISKVEDEKKVILVVESENVSGEEVIVTLYDHPGDFTYQGKEIENNQLVVSLSGNTHKIELEVILNN